MYTAYAIDICVLYVTPTGLLLHFSALDTNMNSALDYTEFVTYTGNSDGTEHAFQAMDLNGDNFVTQKEIEDTIQMLQSQSTEGTEDIPDENKGDLESHNQGEDVPGTQAEPLLANGHSEGTQQSDSNTPDTGAVVPPPSASTDNPDLTVSAPTTTPPPGDLNEGPDTDKKTNENALNMLSGKCV